MKITTTTTTNEREKTEQTLQRRIDERIDMSSFIFVFISFTSIFRQMHSHISVLESQEFKIMDNISIKYSF